MPTHPMNVTEIQMVVHCGTHVDAPCHFFADGPDLASIQLDRLMGPGVVLDIPGEPCLPIDAAMLAARGAQVRPGDIVALHTGWESHVGTPLYSCHPRNRARCGRLAEAALPGESLIPSPYRKAISMDDTTAIQQLHNRYSFGSSTADWGMVLSTLTPDCVWLVPDLDVRLCGHDAIREGFISLTRAIVYVVQENAPAVIEIDGDTAISRCVIRECGKYVDRDAAMEVLGYYTDKLVRTADGWKFSERRFTVRGMQDVLIAPKPQA